MQICIIDMKHQILACSYKLSVINEASNGPVTNNKTPLIIILHLNPNAKNGINIRNECNPKLGTKYETSANGTDQDKWYFPEKVHKSFPLIHSVLFTPSYLENSYLAVYANKYLENKIIPPNIHNLRITLNLAFTIGFLAKELFNR